jgi:hypothetical protein
MWNFSRFCSHCWILNGKTRGDVNKSYKSNQKRNSLHNFKEKLVLAGLTRFKTIFTSPAIQQNVLGHKDSWERGECNERV